MIAIIDADIVAYRCAASCDVREGGVIIDSSDEEIALLRVEQLMQEILHATEADSYRCFLSPSKNFRYEAYPDYKANRKDIVPPKFLQEAREFLVTEWKAKVTHYIEADDALGIDQCDNTVVCSIDKDLLMIPGNHFNWLKQIYGDMTVQSQQDADMFFWKQMLIGDRSDNIIGVRGIGPVKADKFITAEADNQTWFNIVYDAYEYDASRFVRNANCLWIKRSEESLWHKDLNLILPNELQQEQEALLKSTIFEKDGTSMQHTMNL